MRVIKYKLTKKAKFMRIIYEFDSQNDTTFVLGDVTL
jgi:hypothetical protein